MDLDLAYHWPQKLQCTRAHGVSNSVVLEEDEVAVHEDDLGVKVSMPTGSPSGAQAEAAESGGAAISDRGGRRARQSAPPPGGVLSVPWRCKVLSGP